MPFLWNPCEPCCGPSCSGYVTLESCNPDGGAVFPSYLNVDSGAFLFTLYGPDGSSILTTCNPLIPNTDSPPGSCIFILRPDLIDKTYINNFSDQTCKNVILLNLNHVGTGQVNGCLGFNINDSVVSGNLLCGGLALGPSGFIENKFSVNYIGTKKCCSPCWMDYNGGETVSWNLDSQFKNMTNTNGVRVSAYGSFGGEYPFCATYGGPADASCCPLWAGGEPDLQEWVDYTNIFANPIVSTLHRRSDGFISGDLIHYSTSYSWRLIQPATGTVQLVGYSDNYIQIFRSCDSNSSAATNYYIYGFSLSDSGGSPPTNIDPTLLSPLLYEQQFFHGDSGVVSCSPLLLGRSLGSGTVDLGCPSHITYSYSDSLTVNG